MTVWQTLWLFALWMLCSIYFTIPEVRRYCSYEEPDETPNRGARFGSWLPHVMWYFVSQQRGCKWVFVWTLQRSIKFQTPRRRDLHQQAQTNGVVRRSTMGVRAHETPNLSWSGPCLAEQFLQFFVPRDPAVSSTWLPSDMKLSLIVSYTSLSPHSVIILIHYWAFTDWTGNTLTVCDGSCEAWVTKNVTQHEHCTITKLYAV